MLRNKVIKFLIPILLFASAAFADDPQTSYYDFTRASVRLPEKTVATLPAAISATGKVFIVTDGTSASDCTVGGSTYAALCRSSGSDYVSIGGGGGGQGEDSSVIFNVKTEYGAKGDGIELYDGAITSGLTTFTSATASFTSSDIGKVITIFGAGGTNVDLTSTISSINSSTSIEIANAASATVSSSVFRYGTDDTAAIQSAITAIYNSGNGVLAGEVFFPAGIYLVNGAFNKTNNSQIALPTVSGIEKFVTIKFKGAIPPSLNDRASVGSVIFGTKYGTNGTYSMISGGNAALTRVRVVIEDMSFRTVQDPTHSLLNFQYMDMVSGNNISVDTSYENGVTPELQTHNDSYGIRMPSPGNGNVSMALSGVKIKRFYNGIRLTEHNQVTDIMFVYCVNAMYLDTSTYPINIGYASVEQSVNAVYAPIGATYLNIDMLDVEQWGTGNFIGTYTLKDTSNYVKGQITFNILGINGGSPFFLRTGGKNVSTISYNDISANIRRRFRSDVADGVYLVNTSASSTTSGGGIILQQDGDAAVGSGHRLGSINFSGAYNTTNNTNTAASIRGYAAEAFTTSSTGGGDITFWNSPIGSSTQAESMRITNSGKVGIGNTSPSGYLVVTFPSTQTIAAGNTIAGDACGSLKLITSAGAVTTDTTNTFTAPAAGNKGCIMHVCNTGANNITLDNNANFKSAGGADVVLTQDDCVTVGSTGASGVWYQLTALEAN